MIVPADKKTRTSRGRQFVTESVLTSIKFRRSKLRTNGRQLTAALEIDLGGIHSLLDPPNWRLGLVDEQHQAARRSASRHRFAYPFGGCHDHIRHRACLITLCCCYRTRQRPSPATHSSDFPLPLASVRGLGMDCAAARLKPASVEQPASVRRYAAEGHFQRCNQLTVAPVHIVRTDIISRELCDKRGDANQVDVICGATVERSLSPALARTV